jgi:hypothetical protein
MLAIAILLSIGMVLNLLESKGDYNIFMGTSLLIALYSLNIVIFVIWLFILVSIAISLVVRKWNQL